MNPTWINNYRNAKRRSAELSFGDVSDSLIAAGAQHSSAGELSAELEALALMGDDEIQALQQLPEPQQLAFYYAAVEGLPVQGSRRDLGHATGGSHVSHTSWTSKHA
jgi:RNA polymerase sigma-70 factor, ECF subfamily